MNLLAVTLLIFATVPMDRHVVRETVDCLEYNRVYNGDGELYMEQFIAWDWEGERHVVAGWRMMAGKVWRPPLVAWSEGSSTFILRAKYWRETFTQFDVEMEQREIFAKCHRRGLFGVKE